LLSFNAKDGHGKPVTQVRPQLGQIKPLRRVFFKATILSEAKIVVSQIYRSIFREEPVSRNELAIVDHENDLPKIQRQISGSGKRLLVDNLIFYVHRF
jgi:hypothetical protein